MPGGIPDIFTDALAGMHLGLLHVELSGLLGILDVGAEEEEFPTVGILLVLDHF